jgi:hypothetical protein
MQPRGAKSPKALPALIGPGNGLLATRASPDTFQPAETSRPRKTRTARPRRMLRSAKESKRRCRNAPAWPRGNVQGLADDWERATRMSRYRLGKSVKHDALREWNRRCGWSEGRNGSVRSDRHGCVSQRALCSPERERASLPIPNEVCAIWREGPRVQSRRTCSSIAP